MLDTDTKRRIDTARDILVGKVPDRSVWKTFMPEVSRGRGDGRLIRSRGRVGISARAPTG